MIYPPILSNYIGDCVECGKEIYVDFDIDPAVCEVGLKTEVKNGTRHIVGHLCESCMKAKEK